MVELSGEVAIKSIQCHDFSKSNVECLTKWTTPVLTYQVSAKNPLRLLLGELKCSG